MVRHDEIVRELFKTWIADNKFEYLEKDFIRWFAIVKQAWFDGYETGYITTDEIHEQIEKHVNRENTGCSGHPELKP